MIRMLVLLSMLMFGKMGDIYAQENIIKSYNSENLLDRIKSEDTLYIVNFWATWCIPCVKELPYFESANEKFKNKPVKIILLSFDFEEQYPESLTSWIEKKEIKSEVIWFSESKPNDYIPKIAPEWEGSLPATLFINNKKNTKMLVANEVSFEQISNWVEEQ